MLILTNRIKLCSLAFNAVRMCSSSSSAKKPVVYFDLAADNEPLGRVTFEVSSQLNNHVCC